jgi:hypothetical protein
VTLKPTLLLYALCHQFLNLVIEGDELYTKVKKNLPPEDAKGWTIVLLERASRFIWELALWTQGSEAFHWQKSSPSHAFGIKRNQCRLIAESSN